MAKGPKPTGGKSSLSFPPKVGSVYPAGTPVPKGGATPSPAQPSGFGGPKGNPSQKPSPPLRPFRQPTTAPTGGKKG